MATLETAVPDSSRKVVDPVCGMDVAPGNTKLLSIHEGKRYWFCAEDCLRVFEADPQKYLKPKPVKKKGRFGRYLDRMSKINEKEFGCKGPKCH